MFRTKLFLLLFKNLYSEVKLSCQPFDRTWRRQVVVELMLDKLYRFHNRITEEILWGFPMQIHLPQIIHTSLICP